MRPKERSRATRSSPLSARGARPEPQARSDPPTAEQPSDRAPRSKLTPGLHLVATPIGNLGDLSPRARAALVEADVVLCEDTRVTAKLLGLCGIASPASILPRAQRRTPAAGDPGAAARRRDGRRGQRCRHAAGLGPRLQAGARRDRRRDRGVRGARTVRGDRGADRVRPADRPVLRGGLPADPALAAAPRDRRARAGARDARRVRGAPPAPGHARRSGGRAGATPGRGRARADQALRGGAARRARRARGPLRAGRRAARRGRDRDRPGRARRAAASAAELDELLEKALASQPPAAAAATVAAATGRPRREVYRRALELKGR